MGDSEVKNEADTSAKADKKAEGKKNGKLAGFKKEFKKIIWPDKDTVIKETSEVIVVSVILAAVISGIDLLIKLGLDRIL